MNSKRALLFLSISFFSFGIIHRVKKIYWHENIQLKVRDFKADKNAETFDAHTCCTIEYEWKFISSNRFSFTSRAVFYPDSSWFDRKYKKEPTLLKHELYHFNLAEIFSRNMKQKFSQTFFKSQNITAQFDSVVNLIDAKFTQAENDYDSITNHGRNKIKQEWYYHKIDSVLKATKNWGDTLVEHHY